MKAKRILLASAGFVALFGIGVAIGSARNLKAEPPKPQIPVPASPKAAAPPTLPDSPDQAIPVPSTAPEPPAGGNPSPPADLPPVEPAEPAPVVLPADPPQGKKRLRLAPVNLPGSDQVPLPPRPVAERTSVSPSERDPEENVKEFLTRNQQVAERELAELKHEAQMLRTRLQKVEAAIQRWESVAAALEHSQEGVAQVIGSPPNHGLPLEDAPSNLEPVPRAKGDSPVPNVPVPATPSASTPAPKPITSAPSEPAPATPPSAPSKP